METVGFVGPGRFGLPICENLIRAGIACWDIAAARSPSSRIGGVPARSPAEIAAQVDMVFSCLPSSQALDEVVQAERTRQSGALRTNHC